MSPAKKMVPIAAAILLILCGCSDSGSSAEPSASPADEFDDYAMQYFTRIVPGIQMLLTSPGMHVILAGTGQPWFDPIRKPQCIAVIAGGKFILFDAGDGCTHTLDSLDLPINRIDKVFLTHYHSDHVNGLGHLISHTWVNGRQQPIDVYGPEGVQTLTDGFAAASELDIAIRTSYLETLDPLLAVAVPHGFAYPEDGSPVQVWSENGVVVKAFKNDHYDVTISCGYRIEYEGRAVVISGDTLYSERVIQNSEGADLLIHEAANKIMAERAAQLADTLPAPQGPNMALRIRRAIEHHIDTPEVAAVAAQAGVKGLVLTHIIPPIPDMFADAFMQGMDAIYTAGDIMVAKDRDSFYLPPVSGDVVGPCEGPCTP